MRRALLAAALSGITFDTQPLCSQPEADARKPVSRLVRDLIVQCLQSFLSVFSAWTIAEGGPGDRSDRARLALRWHPSHLSRQPDLAWSVPRLALPWRRSGPAGP